MFSCFRITMLTQRDASVQTEEGTRSMGTVLDVGEWQPWSVIYLHCEAPWDMTMLCKSIVIYNSHTFCDSIFISFKNLHYCWFSNIFFLSLYVYINVIFRETRTTRIQMEKVNKHQAGSSGPGPLRHGPICFYWMFTIIIHYISNNYLKFAFFVNSLL